MTKFSWFKMQLWQQIFIGMFFGILIGILFGHAASLLKPIGSLFINAIHMMIVPVIFTAITSAIISVNDPQKMKRIGFKAIVTYAVCMTIAAIIGVLTATVLKPGIYIHFSSHVMATAEVAVPKTQNIADLLISMVPDNPIASFVHGNVLQIVVFAIIIGLSINMAGEKGVMVANLFRSLTQVVFKLTKIVMCMAPYGIFALMAWVTGEFGLSVLMPLLKLVYTIFIALLLNVFLVYFSGILFIVKLNPFKFFLKIMEAILFAFSSTSSAATLPITMRCAEEKLGISPSISGFLLPLGTSLNLNGLSIYLSIVAIFTANIYGIHLGIYQYSVLILTIVLTSMGAGGVPGSALIVMSAVLSSVGLPLATIPLIASVDRIIDMGQTATNVMGDVFASALVARSEKELDDKIYLNS